MAQTLRQAAAHAGMQVGTCCTPSVLQADPAAAALVAREFSCIVAENCMKPKYQAPERGRYDFAAGDELVAFARAHDQRLRGHTLVWHSQAMPWVIEASFTRAEALEVLRDYVQTTVNHFRGSVWCWDVVNEALTDEGDWRIKSPWFRLIGPDYLDHAFRWAHEADPAARLFYNDYGLEKPGPKADRALRLVRTLLDEGVPLHGIGFQGHLGLDNRLDRESIVANIRRFCDLGLEVQFTEVDMGIPQPTTTEKLAQQAEEYATRIAIARDVGATAFVWWGFTDAASWLPSFTKGTFDDGLLFDRACHPKPAYDAVVRALTQGSVIRNR